MGLREKQRLARRSAILSAARELFLDHSYPATKAERIAEAAEISLATLYNYFDSKGEILLTLATQENERVRDHIAKLDLPYGDGAAAVLQAVFASYFAPSAISLNRDLWRIGFALSFSDIQTDGARALRAIDRRMSKQVQQIVEEMQARGMIRADVDCTMLARILFNNVNMLFFDYSRSEHITMADLRGQVDDMTRAMMQLVTDGGRQG